MATIRKRTMPSGKTMWQCDYRDQQGKRRSRQFVRKREAEAHLSEALGDIKKGNYVHEAGSPTLEDNIREWLRSCEQRVGVGGDTHLERATYEDYRGKVHNHLLNPDYGIARNKVHLLGTGVVDDFRMRMIDPNVKGRSAANATKTIAVLRNYLSWAQDRGLIVSNPLAGRKMRYSSREDRRITPPTHEVIDDLLAACPTEKELYLRLAILTGLRASEQRALKWQHTDLKNQAIDVIERVDKYQNVAPPKSAAGYRTIPLGPRLRQDLYEHKTAQGSTIDDLVFPGRNGTYLRHDTEMKSWFEPLREKIGTPRLRWHDLRHYAISTWIETGLNPKTIQTRAGHSSIQITYDRYGYLLEKDSGGTEITTLENRLYARRT